MSTVYVLTNEAMPGLVKVGKTSGSLEKRMRGIKESFEEAAVAERLTSILENL